MGLAVAAMDCPDQPAPSTAGIQQALTSLQAGQYPQAERRALLAATDPNCAAPRAWAIVAAARQRRGQLEAAARAYRMFLASCDSADEQQFAVNQIRLCERPPQPPCTQAAPSKRLTKDRLAGLADVCDDVFTESSEHFVVQARNPDLARLLAVEGEIALDRICRVILAGQEYPHSVRINVWPDRRQYLAHASDAPEWSGGSFRLATAEGTATRQIDLTQRDNQGRFATIMIDRILPHEMCHLVLKEYFGDATCPLFLNEGLAMMAEGQAATDRAELAGKTVAGNARSSLAGLFVRRRYDVEKPAVFYAESFSFVEFLHGRMTDGQFGDLLAHVKDGYTVVDAMQRSLYLPAEESFLPDLASAWEDHAVAQAQYLRALAAADE